MDPQISPKVKNVFLAALDDSYALTNLFVLVFMQFYNGRSENTFEHFREHAKKLISTAGSKYAKNKIAQLIEAIEESFSNTEDRGDLCIVYVNLYVEILNNSWRFRTRSVRMKNIRKQFEAELEGWV